MLIRSGMRELSRPGLVKKVRMPDFFSMSLQSEYGRAAAAAFFSDVGDDALAAAEAARTAAADPEAAVALSREEICFHTSDGDVAVAVDVAKNNQLLGACRQIPPFRWGYEPEIHSAIDALTPPDAVLYDIGANWAPVSFQTALRPGFCGRIYTFEPQRQAYENTRDFISHLHLEVRIYPQNFGVSDRQWDAHLSQENWTGNVHVEAGGEGESCRMMPLDALSLPPPDAIKIDVEGHEAQVIAGASRILSEVHPIVIFEDWLQAPKTVFDLLGNHGYSFFYLCWYSPFLDEVLPEPKFLGDIQVFALMPFTAWERAQLPDRINVLASVAPVDGTFVTV